MRSAIFLASAGLVFAGPAEEFFEQRIRPLLAAKCHECHGTKTATSGLRLDTREGARRGGTRGPAVVPGRPDVSVLLRAVSYEDPDLKMPPTGRLSDQQIADLGEWVRLGAPDPRDENAPPPVSAGPNRALRHWAYQPYKGHPAPRVRDGRWPANWIDRFVLAKLEAKRLRPAPPADRRTLIRRLTFDLTGLPPAPAEVEAFVRDKSPRAYEKLVDRLLASPHYGERWARHWLDLARYAETDGHEFDREKPNAWRYRDYLIRAFNADVPYDQLVREHLAGDLVTNIRYTPDGRLAESPLGTSFYALGEERNAADDLAEVRMEKIDNQIDAIGKTFLGLTIACARCHDHKFDPISTRDYYAMAGVVGSKQVLQASLDSPDAARQAAEWVNELAALQREIAAKITPARPALNRLKPREGDIVIADFGIAEPVGQAPGGWRADGPAFARLFQWGVPPELTGFLTSKTFRASKAFLHVRLAGAADSTSARQPGRLRVSLVGDGRDLAITPDPSGKFTWKTSGLGKMLGELAFIEIADRNPNGQIIVDKIVLSDSRTPPEMEGEPAEPAAIPVEPDAELGVLLGRRAALLARMPEPAYGLVCVEDAPRNMRLHRGGNHKNLGEEIPRGAPSLFDAGADGFAEGSGRLALARALTDPKNPLTARVMVNRIWRRHFGEGLVRTPDNFGLTGERPTHPELLDTLAARFLEGGWSIKKLQKEIAMTASYRMSSRADARAEAIDPDNRLLHHMPVRRLEAESIRDAILAVSGALDPKMYGPSVPPHISEYQDGRGKPPTGPLDGDGRRSIYVGVRRNFLPPLLVAFDYPMTVSTIGRRGVSTVPSQALALMNNEFVIKQAARWADSLQSAAPDDLSRIRLMFAAAYGRPAGPEEVQRALKFLDEQEKRYESADARFRAAADLAHVIFNSKEFIFIR
jgi:cytochrome c553